MKKSTPKPVDDWKPISFHVRGMESKSRNQGALMGATHRVHPCGCRIIGNGSLPHPLEVMFCQQHAAAPELLEALKHHNESPSELPGFCSCPLEDGTRPDAEHSTKCQIARAAIAKAEGSAVSK